MIEKFQELSFWADLLSIIGAVVSVFTLYQVRNLKRRFAFNADVPRLLERLDHMTRVLLDALPDFPAGHSKVKAELQGLLAALDYRRRELPPEARGLLKDLRFDLRRSGRETVDDSWELYGKLLSLKGLIEMSQADRSVGAGNG